MVARRFLTRVLVLLLVAALAPLTAAPAAAGGDEVGVWYFKNRLAGGRADAVLYFGSATDSDFVRGDWDGDGVDDVARRGPDNLLTLRNVATGVERTIAYGKAGDDLFAGDWDGDGDATFAVRRGNLFFFKNTLGSGAADFVIAYGRVGDEVFVGDWDGDGDDTLAVRRGNVFFVQNRLRSGPAEFLVGYGVPGDEVFVGDWDGNGTDSLAVRRGRQIFVRNPLSSGPASTVFTYGLASDRMFAGDWDGDGDDTFAAQRPGPLPGEPFTTFVPMPGESVAVVGVSFDDTLPVHNGPGSDFGIVDGLDPLAIVTGTGEGRLRQDLSSIFWRVGFDSSEGWVRSSFIGRIGQTTDETARVIAELGGTPSAATMEELGRIVADVFAADPPPVSSITVTVAPTVGDLGEVTYDVIGLGDDSVLGWRLVVFGTPDGGGPGLFSLKSVEATQLCARGGSGGLCP